MSRLTLLLSLIAINLACGTDGAAVPSDWSLVESSCGYTFFGPPDIVDEEGRGFDSCFDRWLTDSCEIDGQVAVVTGPPAQLPRAGLIDVEESTETIDGRTARLATATIRDAPPAYRFLGDVIFAEDDLRPRARVTARCSTEAARDETLTLFRSIEFLEAVQ